MKTTTKHNFWDGKKDYPSHWLNPKRMLCDINVLFPVIDILNVMSIRDIGCGIGAHSKIIENSFNTIQYCYLYDFNTEYVNQLLCEGYDAATLDIYNHESFNEISDFDFCLGTLHYITIDECIVNFLKTTADTILIRVPCSIETDRIEIDKYSDELDGNYRATYRTTNEYLQIIKDAGYKDISYNFAYDKSFDSKYGTRQIYFLCRRNSTDSELLVEWEQLQDWDSIIG